MLDEGVQLVDVLAPDEYAEEHLARAMNIPLSKLARRPSPNLTDASRSPCTATTPSET
jgi:rhodanese-related sulfurtransferase